MLPSISGLVFDHLWGRLFFYRQDVPLFHEISLILDCSYYTNFRAKRQEKNGGTGFNTAQSVAADGNVRP
jgi:hypothetical protein